MPLSLQVRRAPPASGVFPGPHAPRAAPPAPPPPPLAARWRGLSAYGYLLPSLIFLTVFTYGPLLVAFTLSLFRWNVLTPRPVFVGLKNYLQMVGDPLFWLVMRNNLFYALGTIPVTMALGLLLALLVNARGLRGKGFYRVALFHPTMIPMVAAGMLWVWLVNPGLGLGNYY